MTAKVGGVVLQLKKYIAFLLSVLMVVLSGCKTEDLTDNTLSSNSDSEYVTAASSQISMLYSSKDSLNPFTCKTNQNRILTQLMYDSLIVLNNSYQPEYNVALSAEYKDKILTVKLKNFKFSDGATVTAQDVVFSFETSKNGSTTYASSFKYVSSVTAHDNSTVVFKLLRNDPYFVNLLTFPIIKYGTDSLKDSDNRELPPIGCGRYVMNVENKTLTPNTYYSDGDFKIKTINLVDAPDSESVNQTVSTGAVDYFFTDLSDNVIPKMNGTSSDVYQSRLVFLGINSDSARLSNTYFRQAVSAALNRKEICSTAYFSKATPAKGPFPSSWKETENFQTIETISNEETVINNLSLAGFTQKDDDGFYLQKNGMPITITLLVSSDNTCRFSAANMIKSDLESAGIKVNLKAVKETEFKTLLKNGSYDLYLSEIRFENNMDLGGLVNIKSADALSGAQSNSQLQSFNAVSSVSSPSSVISDSSAGSSITSNTSSDTPVITLTSIQAYNGFYSGIYTVQDIITAFTAELPVIPVCFRNGLVIYSEKFGSGLTPTVSDIFHGIENLK